MRFNVLDPNYRAAAVAAVATVALALATPAHALEITFAPDIDANPFDFAFLIIADGGTGDLDGTANGEIVFDMNDPSTASLYSGAGFGSLTALSGRVTTAPSSLSFASVTKTFTEPALTLADFEMTAAAGQTAVLSMEMNATVDLGTDGWDGGAVEGVFTSPVAGSSVHFVGGGTNELDLLWDGTVAGMPIHVVKGPGDDPYFSAVHHVTIPPAQGVFDLTGVLQVELGPGDSVSGTPEPDALGLLACALAGLAARSRVGSGGRAPVA